VKQKGFLTSAYDEFTYGFTLESLHKDYLRALAENGVKFTLGKQTFRERLRESKGVIMSENP
jgi:hypothetical protein